MRGIEEHQGWGIGQGFLRSREIHAVARGVGARFGGAHEKRLGKTCAVPLDQQERESSP